LHLATPYFRCDQDIRHGFGLITSLGADLEPEQDLEEVATLHDTTVTRKLSHRLVGCILGLFAGYFTSTNMVPYEQWVERNNVPPNAVIYFTLSQSVGIFFTATAYVLVASIVLRLWKKAWPKAR